MNARKQRIEALFDAALELTSPEQREVYLSRAAADDRELRVEVEALVRAYEKAGGFLAARLDEPGDVPAETVPQTSSGADLSEEPGDRIDRYKLLQKIGEGGCGVVYMAEQEEPVRRRVALKVIKLGMDTKSVIARFEAERQALALMDHPNIAKVLDAGSTQTGRPYFVMELVRGIKITDYCDRNNLPTKQRLELFIQICRAIQHAHQKGIIHRDIKPSNILVTVHDGVPVPKVIDFGIAKATTDQRLTDKTLFTQFEQFIGTPAYMSPEQAEMGGLDIDTRSDIYSLGVLLYELLTGKTPFDPKELLALGLDEMRRTIREKEPVRPSTRLSTMLEGELTTTAQRRAAEAPKLIHALRGDLDWIVIKTLEKDRTRRYDTANGLAMDLQRHLNNEAVSARPPNRLYRFQKLVRRNKLAVAAATAVAAALVFGIVVSSWQAVRAERARQHAQANERKARIAEQNEAKQHQVAEEQKAIAVAQRRTAQEQARKLRRHLYVGDIRTAYQAIRDGEIAYAKQLIQRQFPNPEEEDLRGFEWRYLWSLCQPNFESTFPADGQLLDGAVFSPDGKLLAGRDPEVVVFNFASRQVVHRFEHFGDGPEVTRNLAFSRDGRVLAAKANHQIRAWAVSNWEEIFNKSEAKPNENGGNALVISPDGSALATPVEGGVGFWDLKTGQRIPGSAGVWPTVQGDGFLGCRMVYSSDAAMLAVSDTASIQIRDARSLTMITNLVRAVAPNTTFAWRVLSIAFSTNFLAAGYRDGELRVWETKTWAEVARVKAHATYLTALDFSPDGKLLASGGQQEHVVNLWDINALIEGQSDSSGCRPLTTLKGHSSSINSAFFSPDGELLATTSRNGTTKLWSIRSKVSSTLNLDETAVILWSSPDGKRLITLNNEDKLYQWETSDVLRSHPLNLPTANLDYGPAISSDGKTLALGRPYSSIELWDLATCTRNQVLFPPVRPGEDADRQIEFSPDCRLLITFYKGDGIRVRDLADSTKQRVFTNLAGPFVISEGGAILAAPRRDGEQIELWDIAKNQLQAALEVKTGTGWGTAAEAMAFSPDDRFLSVASSREDSIQIWDLLAKRPIKKLPMPKPSATCMVFSPDMKTFAVQSLDNTITFWNVATWEEMFKESNYAPGFSRILFSKDGSSFALAGKLSASGKSSYRLWRAPSLDEIDALKRTRAGDQIGRPH